jgi:hypothetical protein
MARAVYQRTTTGIPLAVIANQAIALAENRLITQRSEPVGAGPMVNQHDVFTRADRFVFQLDVAESGSMHLWHGSSVRRTLLLDRLGGAQADEPDEAEELTGCDPTARFSLQRSAQFRADWLGFQEMLGTAIDQRDHVLGFGYLQIAVTLRLGRPKTRRPQKRRQPTREPNVVDECSLRGLDTGLKRIPFTTSPNPSER